MIADRNEVEKYLEDNPWPIAFSRARKVEYVYRFHTDATREDVWKFLSDTSELNRQLGLEKIDFTEKEGKLFGSGYLGWKRAEWEEVPWQWENLSDMQMARIYSRGIALYVRIHYSINKSADNGSDVQMYFGWVPAGLTGRILLKLSVGLYEKKFRALIENLKPGEDEKPFFYLNQQIAVPEITREKNKVAVYTGKINRIKDDMIKAGAPAPATEALADFIMFARDDQLYRIRPVELADKLGTGRDDLLKSMLHACLCGMLNMSWDVICPHCRGVRERHPRLWEIGKSASCEVCDIEFAPGSLNMIEITFSVNPEIRKVDRVLYCSAEPAKKPHIILQKILQPGSSYLFILPQYEKRLRFRMKGKKYYGLLDLKKDTPLRNLNWDDINSTAIIETAPGSTVFINNTAPATADYVIEYTEDDVNALRPSDIFSYQEFRDLYSSEAVATDLSIDIGMQNIMFVDVVGSTSFYGNTGDSHAFLTMRQYFARIHEIASDFRGAIVKTLGDGVMLVFDRPMNAVKAGIRILKTFSGEGEIPLTVRVSLHRGHCLAVNLDTSIDYFGQAVNVAAKLQNFTGSGEMTLSESFASELTVEKYLAEKGYTKNFAQAQITGAGSVRYLKIRVRK
ncbi:MAG: adenylate/guanylate cyclase domain-containing protein [Spirochaetes bacterium]|nr:adenylate/guanylate cyclase domain-containing protein [Spirochaetota bacterium]